MLFTVAGLQPESGGPARSLPALCTAVADEKVDVELITLDFGFGFNAPMLPNRDRARASLSPGRGWEAWGH